VNNTNLNKTNNSKIPINSTLKAILHDNKNYKSISRKNSSINSSNKANNILASVFVSTPNDFPTNVSIKNNPNLFLKSKNEYEKYSKCVIKSGLLYLLKANLATPVYVNLNSNALTIQDNLSINSIIQVIMLNKILRVTQIYKGTNCFDIIEEKNKDNFTVQLCAMNKDDMESWILGILEFKECLLQNKFEIIDANLNAFKKEKNINQLNPISNIVNNNGDISKDSKDKIIVIKNTPLKSFESSNFLYYTNTLAPPTSESITTTKSSEILTKILNDQKREEIAQRQIKRRVEDQIRKVKEANQKIILEQKKLARENSMTKKKELIIISQKIEEKADNFQKKILKNVLNNLHKLNVS
jgi:hypothetical protein